MSKEYLYQRDNKYMAKSQALLDELPYYVKQFYDGKKGSKKEMTRHAYLLDIKAFLTYLAPIHHAEVKTFPIDILGSLTIQDIIDYKDSFGQKYKPATERRKLASLSTFFKYLVVAKVIDNNPVAALEFPTDDKSRNIVFLDNEQTVILLEGILRNDKQLYYRTDEKELTPSSVPGKGSIKGIAKRKSTDYIVRNIDDTITKHRREKVKLRNYVITFLFLKTGLRVSELVSIDLTDIDWRNTTITVIGKGGKSRPVGFGEELLVNKLRLYIETDRKELTKKNPTEPALFVSTRGSRMSVKQVETMIKEMVQTYLADDESIMHSDFSPHKLRSTCATRLLEQTGDIKGVSDLLGHDNLNVTSQHYAFLNQLRNAQDMQGYEVCPGTKGTKNLK